MARFIVDEQLPPVLCRLLRKHGHEASDVYELGLAGAPDRQIRREAKRRDAILITKDDDFVTYLVGTREGLQLLCIRLGNASNQALIRKLEPLLDDIVEAFNAGESVIEVR